MLPKRPDWTEKSKNIAAAFFYASAAFIKILKELLD